MAFSTPLDDPKRAHHYHVEIGLADRLRKSSRAERKDGSGDPISRFSTP